MNHWYLLWIGWIIMSMGAEAAENRVHTARERHTEWVHARFEAVGLAYPPGDLLLVGLKWERELRVYAAEKPGDPWVAVHTFPVLGSSGTLGRKLREGDRQVPEGLYRIDRFNPRSRFHLSLGLDYPNAEDRLVADPLRPGSDIFIHGGNQTIGCLPIGDEGIERLYLICHDVRGSLRDGIPVWIFPGAMTQHNWHLVYHPFLQRKDDGAKALREFWRGLQPFWDQLAQVCESPPKEPDGREGYPE